MSRSRPSRATHPNSPVQPGGGRPGPVFATAIIVAVALWAIQQNVRFDEPERAVATEKSYTAPSGSPTRAKGNLLSYFASDDYPIEAIRREETGTVRFKLQIDARGRVEDCAVVQSSGSSSLDHATCDIIRRRARYEPARDAGGRAVPDVHTGQIRWELPDS